MENLKEFFEIIINSEKLIHYGGLALLLIVIVAETGLIIGFIFPGDALLFTAGLLCGNALLFTAGLLCGNDLSVNIWLLVISVALAAIAGNIIGFITGKFLGKRLFLKKDNFFFKQRHIEQSNAYYEKYGGIVIVGGRFIPVVRTFVPILAGAINMEFVKFSLFNISGAI
ncbi:MAG: VTT domain-containing protein, partial [Bacteroidia bacterium]|nr:VTT domain-containing protein [Bacteroidia bacterium]